MIFILYCIYLPKKFLVDAVESGNVTVVKLLLLLGVDPDVKRGLPLGDIDYGEQVPVITRAAMNGDKEIVRALINAGANVNAAGRYYQVSPLEGANMSKNNEIIRMLKVAGAKE
jgi:ankyrin repeat protein